MKTFVENAEYSMEVRWTIVMTPSRSTAMLRTAMLGFICTTLKFLAKMKMRKPSQKL